ncbi:hypothetical protein [Blastomonas sp. UPD001]|uniref:hypothetical protein n=1 Tax=Blastomonas sp. UPD001 TaxID=2217673 RepID=UPI000E35025A|nr:hypothetical protein [Blastomonas sp. UPD001]
MQTEGRRDWKRLVTWPLIGFIVGYLCTPIPADVAGDPVGTTVTSIAVGLFYAVAAVVIAGIVTMVSKAKSKTSIPFKDMDPLVSIAVCIMLAGGASLRAFSEPSLMPFFLAIYPIFRMARAPFKFSSQ